MTLSAAEALAEFARQVADPVPPLIRGRCLQKVREVYGIAARYPSATAAWNAIPQDQRHVTAPEPGSAGYWIGGGEGFGHIVGAYGQGLCYSTDVARTGCFDLTSFAEINRRWGQGIDGLMYVGWSWLINDVEIPHADAPQPPPQGDEFDMATLDELRTLLHESAAQMRPVQVPGLPEVYAWDGSTMLHVYDPAKLNGLRACGAIVADVADTLTDVQFDEVVGQIKAWGRWSPCGCGSATCRLVA